MAYSFGTQPAITQTQVPFGGFSFGGATSTTTTPSLSTSFASASLPGTQMGFGTALTTTTSSLFGNTMSAFAPASTSTSLFPTLGQGVTSLAPSAGFSFGGFGAPSSSIPTLNFGSSLTGTSLATSTPVSVGLGGIDIQASSAIDSAGGISKKDKAVKENLIPNELSVHLESFKKYIKDQKEQKEEMSRGSSKNIAKVQKQVSVLRQLLSVLSNGVQRDDSTIAKLKQDSSAELRNAEIAQRTNDTPPSLQYENLAPSGYFHNMSISFENQMQSYRQQIELLERHLLSLSQPTAMTPDELTIVMKRLHDAFVTLAAQLHTAHQHVHHQKEQFLNIQKANHSELGDIFGSKKRIVRNITKDFYPPLPLTVGPAPAVTMPSDPAFVAVKTRIFQLQANKLFLDMNPSAIGTGFTGGSFINNAQPSLGTSCFNLQNTSSFKPLAIGQAGVPSFGSSGLGSSGFSGDSGLLPYGSNNQKPFQLQKPPSGNKRGKRWTST